MHKTMGRTLLPGMFLLALIGAPADARGELAAPSCEALTAWTEGFDRGERWQPNGFGGRDRFYALFMAGRTASVFGRPVLDWTAEEARGLGPAFAACADALRRGGNRAAQGALAALRIQIGREVPNYLTALAEAREAVPRAFADLAEAPASLPLLRFHAALAALGTEAEAHAQASRLAARVPEPARGPARALMAALRDLPEPEALRDIPPPAAARAESLRLALREEFLRELEGIEASPAGLHALDRHARQDHAAELGPESAQAIAAAIAARRAAIGASMRDALIRQVEAAPLSPLGAQMLDRLRQQAAQQFAPAIGPEGMGAIEAAIRSRRGEIGTALRTELIASIATMPPSLASLRTLHEIGTRTPGPVAGLMGPDGVAAVREAAAARRPVLAADVAGQIATQIGAAPPAPESFAGIDGLAGEEVLALLEPEGAAQVRAAATARRQAVAAALLPEFRRTLAALPQTEEGMAEIDERVMGGIAAWPDSAAAEKAEFTRLATERRTAILAALNRAEAGPMRGRVYEGPLFRLEFVDRTRVIVTPEGMPQAAGTYTEERDGRIIVTVNAQSMVFTREGRRLTSGPITVRRVP